MHQVMTQLSERIYTLDIDDEDMNTRLIERIESTGDERDFLTNVKALETDNLLHRGYPEIETLCKKIRKFAIECSFKENLYQSPNHEKRARDSRWVDVYVNSMNVNAIWGTRYEKTQIVKPHNHWSARWAFTYYIDPPENAQGLWITDAGVEIPIEHGRLLLFRGHVIHETKPVELKGYRYCVAGVLN